MIEIGKWAHVAFTWKRGNIQSQLKIYHNGNNILEENVTENAALDFWNSGRSVYDIGKVLYRSVEERAHAYLSDLVIFNRELSKHELTEELVLSHVLHNFI